MSKINKPTPDKFLKLVKKQDEPKPPPRPENLGESTLVTDWYFHIHAKHSIRNYTKIQKDEKNINRAYVNTPNPGMKFVAVKEEMHGFHFIWILCVSEKTGRIFYKFNSGDVEFVTWDIPAEDEKPEK